ncbi:MAG TPA: OadG family protein [Spirochaetales bacterium]|nr:OadG family protein [Spirochaetales bacterium]
MELNHWMITALGMGTVFLALIALSLIVSLFPFFFRKPEKKRGELAPLPELNEPTPRPAGIGPELVAVIAAAVAASSGMAPGSFRVSSVEAAEGYGPGSAAGFNTPVWGHIDRFSRASRNS